MTDGELARAAAVRARGLGFGGKLCIHPHQVDPVAAGFRPSVAQVAWATAVLDSATEQATGEATSDVFTVDGEMVDLPVLARARSVVARSKASDPSAGRF
jgi:citrate lyase beta subunit